MSVLDDMRSHFDAGFEDDTEVSEVGYLRYLSSTGLKYLNTSHELDSAPFPASDHFDQAEIIIKKLPSWKKPGIDEMPA
ncbi:hypothetical protein E4U51_003838 [Claviceps purpurea]|nr:hypothetical protein E4U51_003838 [Claviceps purpurea]